METKSKSKSAGNRYSGADSSPWHVAGPEGAIEHKWMAKDKKPTPFTSTVYSEVADAARKYRFETGKHAEPVRS